MREAPAASKRRSSRCAGTAPVRPQARPPPPSTQWVVGRMSRVAAKHPDLDIVLSADPDPDGGGSAGTAPSRPDSRHAIGRPPASMRTPARQAVRRLRAWERCAARAADRRSAAGRRPADLRHTKLGCMTTPPMAAGRLGGLGWRRCEVTRQWGQHPAAWLKTLGARPEAAAEGAGVAMTLRS